MPDTVEQEAEKYQAPERAKTESSRTLFDEISKDGANPYTYNQGADASTTLSAVDRFINEKGLPQVELIQEVDNKISVRVLDAAAKSVQTVMPDGKVVTKLPDGKTLEYDPSKPAAERYALTTPGSPPTTTRDASVEPLKGIIEKPLVTKPARTEGDASVVSKIYADGRVVESYTYTPADKGNGKRSEATFYPPGTRADGLRETEKFNANPAGTTPEAKSPRTVERFDATTGKPARTETQFTGTENTIKIDKVVAYKTPPGGPDGVAVETNYKKDGADPNQTGRGPEGITKRLSFPATDAQGRQEITEKPATDTPRKQAERTTKFRDGVTETVYSPKTQPTDKEFTIKLPNGVTQEKLVNGTVTTSFETPRNFSFKNGANTESFNNVTKIERAADGKLTFTPPGSPTGDKPATITNVGDTKPLTVGTSARTGDVRVDGTRDRATTPTPDAPVRPGEVKLDANGNAESMKIGDKEYKVTRGADGQISTLEFGTPPTKLTREGDKWSIAPPPPAGTRELNMDGMKLRIGTDGKVTGDIQMNKKGEMYYKSDNGPHRVESIKKPDGAVVNIDFKTYERTEFKSPGTGATPDNTKFWDGFNWRDGTKTVNGNTVKIEFSPKPGEAGYNPNKPSVMERTSNPPGTDQAKVIFRDNTGKETKTIDADWQGRKQVEKIPPDKTRELFYDGSTYREGTRSGDTVTFKDNKDGEAVSAKYRADGGVETKYGTPPSEREVIRDKNGFVTEVKENGKKTREFKRDADGDVREQLIYGPDGQVKERWRRKLPEAAPLMGASVGREGADKTTLSQPGRGMPRAIGNTKDFNTWERVKPDGSPLDAADKDKPENQPRRENVFVTADGAVVKEKPRTGAPPSEIEISHLGKGTVETRNGNNRTFRGPDGATLESKDDGKKWRLAGQPDSVPPIEGTPVVGRDGKMLIKEQVPKPGSTTGEKIEKVHRVNKDSISELDSAGKEVRRTTKDGTVMSAFDAAGNPGKVKAGNPPNSPELSYKWEGTPPKVTEIKNGDTVTHKMDGTNLRKVNGAGFEGPNLTVRASDGKLLEKATNPADGTIERFDNNVAVVSDANGVPVRMEQGGKTFTVEATKNPTTGEITINKVKDGPNTIADAATPGKGAIRLENGRVVQEVSPGSKDVDVYGLDGLRVRQTDSVRERVIPGKFEFKADLKPSPQDYSGELKANGQTYKFDYDGTKPAERGGLRTLKKLTVPAGADGTGQPEKTFEIGKGDPKVSSIKIDEQTGTFKVSFEPKPPATEGSATLYNPSDAANFRTTINGDGVGGTFNKDGKQVRVIANGGAFGVEYDGDQVKKVVLEPAAPPSKPEVAITKPDAPGSLTVNADGTVTEIRGNQRIVHRPGAPRATETTTYPDAAKAASGTEPGDTVVAVGDRKLTFNKEGELTKGESGGRQWEITPPTPALKRVAPGFDLEIPAGRTIDLKDGTGPIKLGDKPGEKLTLKRDGTLVHTRPGDLPPASTDPEVVPVTAVQRETVYLGNGSRVETVRVNPGTPNAEQTRVQIGPDGKVQGFEVPGTRMVAIGSSEARGVQAQYNKDTGELTLQSPSGAEFVYTAKGERFLLKPPTTSGGPKVRERKALRRR